MLNSKQRPTITVSRASREMLASPNKFLPPLPPAKTDIFVNPLSNKNEVHLGSLVQKLKEDRIVQVMNRQMAILEELAGRISNREEEEQKKMSDYVERLEKEREEFLRQQRNEELIRERVEKKIRDYLSYGMGYNPYYPSLLPYLIFNLPKQEKARSNEEEKEKKPKKKSKKTKKKAATAPDKEGKAETALP